MTTTSSSEQQQALERRSIDQSKIFAFMSRSSAHAVDRFRVPSNALVEIGRRIEL
jgi:KUP system potassium uptake protein